MIADPYFVLHGIYKYLRMRYLLGTYLSSSLRTQLWPEPLTALYSALKHLRSAAHTISTKHSPHHPTRILAYAPNPRL